MQQQDRDTIEKLLPYYCERQVTEEERQKVELWMNESEENRRIVAQIYSLYLATDTVNIIKKVDTEEALVKVNKRMTSLHRITRWEWTQRIAVVLVIPLLVVCLVQYFGRVSKEPMQMVKVRTNPGTVTSLTLPDGTLVFLNSESALAYPSRFDGDTREVKLDGEAYFEVAKQKGKSFIVSTTQQTKIKVLGTHFNVEAYKKDEFVSTTLTKGKVCFVYKQEGVEKEAVMNPGQKLIYNLKKQKLQLYITSGESETAWKDGKIIFKDTPLEEALRMLEKRYSVEFIIKSNRLKEYSFTGTFENQHLNRILEYFQLSSNIHWQYLDSLKITDKKSKIEIY